VTQKTEMMMNGKSLIALMAFLPLAACAATDSGIDTGAAPLEMKCVADKVQHLVGQKVTDATGPAVLKATGARVLRWGPPRSAWTADLRTDRVNISYDDDMMIGQISCG
jgi:hypothetical protein